MPANIGANFGTDAKDSPLPLRVADWSRCYETLLFITVTAKASH
jgi:hypothetical protein